MNQPTTTTKRFNSSLTTWQLILIILAWTTGSAIVVELLSGLHLNLCLRVLVESLALLLWGALVIYLHVSSTNPLQMDDSDVFRYMKTKNGELSMTAGDANTTSVWHYSCDGIKVSGEVLGEVIAKHRAKASGKPYYYQKD